MTSFKDIKWGVAFVYMGGPVAAMQALQELKRREVLQQITQKSRSSSGYGGGRGGGGGGLDLLPWPKVDFTKFGPIETKPLSKIKKISGQNLSRNWVMIPHVTYHEEADITELEEFRVATNKENAATGVKVTVLAFLIKASAMALKKHPEFNSSIDGDNIVFKHYFHIGFAADTPAGLVVPVIRNVVQKSVTEIAAETSVLAKKAREGKLTPAEMSGACFTISRSRRNWFMAFS
jgi:pyruvate dehydrogenase E2 component (dihydrolipoamide acetyltransferase)